MKTISIIGAGTMGRGIALSCLEAGYVTSKYDEGFINTIKRSVQQ